jgi:hypothetical protein
MPSYGSVGYTDPGTRRISVFDPTLNSGHAAGLWKTCPLTERLHDSSIGVLLDENFQSYDPEATNGDWVLTQAVSGSAAISTTYPGALAIDAGAATAAQGANLQRVKSAFLPAANKSIWFECEVRMTTAIVAELFIGLAAIDTSIIAASAQTTNNRIGWGSVTDNGVLLFQSDKAGTGTTAAAATVSTSAWTKLGFFYDGVADTLQQYVDSVATGTAIATTHIPKAVVYPTLVCQGGGSGQPVLNVRSLRVFQLN